MHVPKTYFVYIITNRSKTLYTGVTNNLIRGCGNIVPGNARPPFKHTQPQHQVNTVSPEVRSRCAQLSHCNSFRSHSALMARVCRAAA